MTGTDCGLFTHKKVPVMFEPPCIYPNPAPHSGSLVPMPTGVPSHFYGSLASKYIYIYIYMVTSRKA